MFGSPSSSFCEVNFYYTLKSRYWMLVPNLAMASRSGSSFLILFRSSFSSLFLSKTLQSSGNKFAKCTKQCCGTVNIFYGSGSDFWKVTVPVPTFYQVTVPVPAPYKDHKKHSFQFFFLILPFYILKLVKNKEQFIIFIKFLQICKCVWKKCEMQGCGSGSGLDPYSIGSVDPDPDPDPGGQKWPTKVDNNL